VRITAIAAAKGGTGKTTTAVTLAHAFALAGRRTLLVDLDPRRQAALHFGLAPTGGLAAWLGGGSAHAVEVRPGLRVLDSGGTALVRLELHLHEPPSDLERIRAYLRSVENVDEILLDCGPSCGPMQTAALLAADDIILPVGTDFLGLASATAMRDEIRSLRRRDGGSPRLRGILATFYEPGSPGAEQTDAVLAERFAGGVLRTRVRRSESLRAAAAFRGTVFETDPVSEGALDYVLLAREVLAPAR
jgi:chromosome partitioning protein